MPSPRLDSAPRITTIATAAAERHRRVAGLAVALVALTVGGNAKADPARWEVDPAGSALGFTGTIEGNAFDGRFERFNATVSFDPADPTAGEIAATIELASVDTDNAERDSYLVDEDFFHVEAHPRAAFRTTAIRAGETGYIADATLSLRGKTCPVTMTFDVSLPATTPSPARLTGTVVVDRLEFDVGSGDWADTALISQEISVTVGLDLRAPD